jgi:hypothetical protein
MKDKILLVDSSAEHRGFFSTINLTLLTLLYCKKNNIQPIIGNSVLSLYSSKLFWRDRTRPFSEFFGEAYDESFLTSTDSLEISWVDNNQLLSFDDEQVVQELRLINNELLVHMSPTLKEFITIPPLNISNSSLDISVHYRGCDYLKNTPIDHSPNLVPESFIELLDGIIRNKKIFVATDDDSFLKLLIDMGIDVIYFEDVYRKGPGRGSHIRTRWQRLGFPSRVSQKQKGFEVFRDCFWLSKSNLYIGTNSNLMFYSSLLNPSQNLLNVNKL